MKKRILVLFVLMIFTANAYAVQRTFVSAGSGVDTNPCTRTAPCRSFTAAIPFTDADGEVIALDSGGYGPVTITQAVSITSPAGVYAGITATTGSAVTLSAPADAHIALRNLFMNSIGADYGVSGDSVGELYVDGCTITGFNSVGILFAPSMTSTGRVSVSNSTIRHCGEAGIDVSVGHGTVESVYLLDTKRGMKAEFAQASVRNCVSMGNSFYGYYSGINGLLYVEDSVASNDDIGFYANSGMMTISRCICSANLNGIISDLSGTTIYVSDSTITTNAMGLGGVNGTISSRGNNTLIGNTTDGAFTATFSAQ